MISWEPFSNLFRKNLNLSRQQHLRNNLNYSWQNKFYLNAKYPISLPVHAKAVTDVKKCKFYSISNVSYFSCCFANHQTVIGASGYRMEIRQIQALDKASTNVFSREKGKSRTSLSLLEALSASLADLKISSISPKIAFLKREQRLRLRSISSPHPSPSYILRNG